MIKIKKILNRFYKKARSYIYTNRLFITYLILAITGTIIIREVTIKTSIVLKPMIADMAFILIFGAFGYFVKPKNQFKYFLSCLIFFAAVEVINSVYYTFYTSFASLTELATLSQVETVTDSVFDQLRIIDFIYILEPVIFYYIHHTLKNSSYYNMVSKVENGKRMAIGTLIAGGIFLAITFLTASGSDYSRLHKQWNRNYNVERFGIIMYQLNDAVQTVRPKISSLFGYEDAVYLFNEYFENEEVERYDGKNKYTNILKGYNIIYVHMESMQNFLMDLEFNGREVTPNLKKLAKEGMFFSNFYPQVSTGTSSDAEYITLTGLLPSSSGPVFVSYSDNTFRTLPSLLKEKGYYTFSMHGNYASMWNRSNVHPKLGYTDMYYRDTFKFTDEDVIGLGINDKLFFKEAIEKLEQIEANNDNYFGTIITLSNHSPFKATDAFTLDINDYYINELGEDTSTCYLCERDVGRYIRSSSYADEALGDFINYINNSNYFNNTIFVFYGDHDAKLSYKEMNYLYNYDYLTGEVIEEGEEGYTNYDIYDHYLNKKTPLIIWTKNKKLSTVIKGKNDNVMGMYDLAPTLYNMLGIDNKYVIGHDIFNIKSNNIVVFPNGNYLTNNVYYNNSTGEYKIIKDGTILDSNYISDNIEYSNKALEVGNSIISHDLFNKKGE